MTIPPKAISDDFDQEHRHDAPAFHPDGRQDADLARALENRHDQGVDDHCGGDRRHDQVEEDHEAIGKTFGLDDQLVELRPGQHVW